MSLGERQRDNNRRCYLWAAAGESDDTWTRLESTTYAVVFESMAEVWRPAKANRHSTDLGLLLWEQFCLRVLSQWLGCPRQEISCSHIYLQWHCWGGKAICSLDGMQTTSGVICVNKWMNLGLKAGHWVPFSAKRHLCFHWFDPQGWGKCDNKYGCRETTQSQPFRWERRWDLNLIFLKALRLLWCFSPMSSSPWGRLCSEEEMWSVFILPGKPLERHSGEAPRAVRYNCFLFRNHASSGLPVWGFLLACQVEYK